MAKVYRWLLLFYPAAFRRRFGDEMSRAFVDQYGARVGRGRRATLRFWINELAGVGRGVIRVRGEDGTGRPHGSATLVFVLVLAAYALTLAPTVTFWDAGEFLAASHTLGIPHPPGTPVFVMLSNVWARVVPFGEFAFRVNLMTACFGAASVAMFFMIVWRGMSRGRRVAPDAKAPACAAALVGAFTFTVWQNSTETEVYTVAAFLLAAGGWLAVRWRDSRRADGGVGALFLMMYVSALSVGNHLLGLLGGPAAFAFMWLVMRDDPLSDARARSAEWSRWGVMLATWLLLVAIGVGARSMVEATAVACLVATVYAWRRGEGRFAVTVAAVGFIGVSSFLFLYIRAGLAPFINEADPSTWEALLAVIRRDQYPVRLPIDNPLFDSGPGNPGRPLALIWLQIVNYLQYFDWQWSAGLSSSNPLFAPLRLPFTLAFVALGVLGAATLRRRDPHVFWLLVLIFAVTGPGLVGYLNFKPGFSIGYDLYPGAADHEVRERDYFFLVSFQVWGAFAGIGIVETFRRLTVRVQSHSVRWGPGLATPVLGLALVPAVLNYPAAERAVRPEAALARDYAYDLLQTVEPYGVLFTGGDNDSFPVWYAQAVEAIRPDVTVVVLPLANTPWFIKQLRDRPIVPFEPEQAPWFADMAPARPPPPPVTWSDDEIDRLGAVRIQQPFRFRAGEIDRTYEAGTTFFVQDLLTLHVIQENVGRRPVYFASSAGTRAWVRLGDSLIQEGLAYRVYSHQPPDVARLAPGVPFRGQTVNPPLDLPRTDSLAWDVYRYARLFEVDSLKLDPTHQNIASNLGAVFLGLAHAHSDRNANRRAIDNLERAHHLMPTLGLRSALDAMRAGIDLDDGR